MFILKYVKKSENTIWNEHVGELSSSLIRLFGLIINVRTAL